MCNREKDQKILKRMYRDKLLKTVSDKLWVVKNLLHLAHILNHDSYTDNNTKPCLILKEQTVNQTKAEGNAFFCGFSANLSLGRNTLMCGTAPHLCRAAFYWKRGKWVVTHGSYASICLVSVPFIHMDDQICLCLFLSHSITAPFPPTLSVSPYSSSKLLSSMQRHISFFFIVCLLVRWHTTHCGV